MMGTGERKRKLILVSITCVLCITIMLSGTFAWSNLGQSVINETMGEMINPGGRLHDDFNGSNKDIYVENFTAGVDSMDIIVRIRLSEYMELGENAGDKTNRANVETLTKYEDADGNMVDANINDTSTWNVFSPIQTNNNHYGYWNWSMGGQTVYMPTANTDTDSNEVDRNGIYPFDDYKEYEVNEESSDGSGRKAKKTIDGTVMSMAQWIQHVDAGGEKLGDFWVYDADGWAYWASPLPPQEATGLLLDKISHSKIIENKWYYAINVECQMVTVDEIGSESNPIGFYSERAKKAPSASARWLLDELIEEIGYIKVEAGTEGLSTTDISEEELEALLNQYNAEKETIKETEEEKEKLDESEDENNPDVTEGDEQNPDDETNQDGNPSEGTGEDAENGQEPGEGEGETTTPEDTNTENGTGNGTTGDDPNGDSTIEGGNGQNDTPTNPEDLGNTNPDNPVTGTDTSEGTGDSENGGTAPQEPGTEPTGISEGSGDVLVPQYTSQLF